MLDKQEMLKQKELREAAIKKIPKKDYEQLEHYHVLLLGYGTEQETKDFISAAEKEISNIGQLRELKIFDLLFTTKNRPKVVNFLGKYNQPEYFERSINPESAPMIKALISRFTKFKPLTIISNPITTGNVIRAYVLGYFKDV